jgi:cytochrome c biogenesis protein CcdA
MLAYLGGALTTVSPCILPVLRFVFARGSAIRHQWAAPCSPARP